MEYTINALANIAGISTRTIRYYDEIDLLKPLRINSSGYRIYGAKEVDRLQHILFYRELGLELEKIKEIIISEDFDELAALKNHREKLQEKRKRLDTLIETLDTTIKNSEEGLKMKDKDKFNGFKKKLIEDNEKKYGEEIRSKYGNKQIDKSNKKVMDMTEEQFDEANRLAAECMELLHKAMDIGDAASETAQKAAEIHKKWLMLYWDKYTKEAHVGLAQMYVLDERFKAFYDKERPGTAEFLRDAILIYTSEKFK